MDGHQNLSTKTWKQNLVELSENNGLIDSEGFGGTLLNKVILTRMVITGIISLENFVGNAN